MTSSAENVTSSIVSVGEAIALIGATCRSLARALIDIELAATSMLDAAKTSGVVLSPTVLAAVARIRTQAAAARLSLSPESAFLGRYVDLVWQSGAIGTALADSTMFRSAALIASGETPVAQLDHVKLARQQLVADDGNHDRWLPFGPRTAIRPLERLSYLGTVAGRGSLRFGGALYAVAGQLVLELDFPASSFSGALAITGKDERSGARRDFGALVIASGTIADDGSLDGVVQAADGTFLGFLEGALYGPKSEEFGVTFGILSGSYQDWDPHYATAANLVGAAIGRRSP